MAWTPPYPDPGTVWRHPSGRLLNVVRVGREVLLCRDADGVHVPVRRAVWQMVAGPF